MAVETTPLLDNQTVGQSNGLDEQEKPVHFVKRFGYESKNLWKIAGPAIFTAICQYSLGALTQTFAGLVSELDLAAVAVENSVIAGLAYGVMVSSLFTFNNFLVSGSLFWPIFLHAYISWVKLK